MVYGDVSGLRVEAQIFVVTFVFVKVRNGLPFRTAHHEF